MAAPPSDKVLTSYLREAAQLNADEVKPQPQPRGRIKRELVVPDYFSAAIQKNKKAFQAFQNFSYSTKKNM